MRRASETAPSILIVGVGGLGAAMVREGLERGVRVSAMVRHPDRLRERLTPEEIGALNRVIVGDGTDPVALDDAVRGVDVVLSGKGADRRLAEQLAQAVARHGIGKLIWPAGGTNLRAENGVDPAYLVGAARDPEVQARGEQIYRAHQVCIDAIREVGINAVVFCPGRMASGGRRSPAVASTIRVDRPAGKFITFEDAAWVMLEAALSSRWDHQLIGASTPE